jgi:hypothetical protein
MIGGGSYNVFIGIKINVIELIFVYDSQAKVEGASNT